MKAVFMRIATLLLCTAFVLSATQLIYIICNGNAVAKEASPANIERPTLTTTIPQTDDTPVVDDNPTVEQPSVQKPITPTNEWAVLNDKVSGTVSIVNIKEYPVVTTPENQNEYLNKDIYGNKSKKGTLFTAEDAIFGVSKVTTIFGHSMKDGDMFGNLKQFKSLDYLKENPTFEVSNADSIMTCKIVAVANVSANYQLNKWYYAQSDYSTESQFVNFVRQVRSRSKFVIPDQFDYESNYILLSTCDYDYEDDRLIIVARIMSDDETIDTSTYKKNSMVVHTAEYYDIHGGSRPEDKKIAEVYYAQYG